MDVIGKLIEASPYLGFVLLFIWLEIKREEKRVENAAALETRREIHEKGMLERQLQQDRNINELWASYIQQLVNEIKLSHAAIIRAVEEHEKESEDRYEKMSITKDLFKAAAERKK
jgi:hypothetical protein